MTEVAALLRRPSLIEDFERLYVRPKAGRALIVGSRLYPTKRVDRRELYSDSIGVDMQEGDGVDVLMDLTKFVDGFGPFAHIDCLSVFEHCTEPKAMAKNICRLLEPHGTLFVCVPFVWRVHGYPDDYWRFSVSGVKQLFPSINWTRICYAHTSLSDEFRVPQTIIDGHIYFARTEVFGFGARRA